MRSWMHLSFLYHTPHLCFREAIQLVEIPAASNRVLVDEGRDGQDLQRPDSMNQLESMVQEAEKIQLH